MRARSLIATALVSLAAALAAAAPAAADHCDPNTDPNCGPHTPSGPGGVTPPCSGSVGPVHAWPCPAQSTNDCVRAATSPTACPAVQVTIAPVSAGPVTFNGASTDPIYVPVPNAYGEAQWVLASSVSLAERAVCYVKTKDFRTCFDYWQP
jgi:ABC-type amino acid transport substrate-binding protein